MPQILQYFHEPGYKFPLWYKNEFAKHCWEADHDFNWDQKKVIDRESRLIPRKIKETIHSLKNPDRINKIFNMLPGIWLPNLR